MQSGPMRQRVTLQTLTETPDAFGQPIKTWTTVGTYWAAIRNLTGRELYNAKQIKATATHAVEMRYVAAIAPEQRLLFGASTYQISWVND